MAVELRVEVDLVHERIEGEAVHHLRRTVETPGPVRFHQGGLQVRSVEVDGAPAPFRVDAEWLEVDAGAASEATVRVSYTTRGEGGVHFRGGRDDPRGEPLEAWTLSSPDLARTWFPTWDHPSERFTITTTLVARSDLGAWANGRLVRREDLGHGRTATTWTLDHPVPAYVVGFVVGRLREIPLGDRTWAVVPDGDDRLLAAARGAVEARSALEALLGGPYPYGEYRQVVLADFPYAGMENAALVSLGERAAADEADAVVVHELAHQWLGDLVGCATWRDLWLSEGLASWADHRVDEQRRGPTVAAGALRADAARARGVGRALAPSSGTLDDATRFRQVYAAGPVVMHQLEATLGRAVVEAAVRDHLERSRDAAATTDDLRAALERASGRDLGPWFATWVRSADWPEIHTSWRWDAGKLEVQATWDGPGPSEVVGWEVDGRRLEPVELGPGTRTWTVDLEQAPGFVTVDPDGALLLARWERTQTEDAWRAQSERASTPLGRLDAVDHLAAHPGPGAVAHLEGIALDPQAPEPLRVHAVAGLALDAPGPRTTLLDLLGAERSTALRRAAAEAVRGEEAVPDLRALAARDPDDAVAIAALVGLSRSDPLEAVELARGWLGAPTEARREAALERLAVGGDARDLRAVLARTDPRRASTHEVRAATDAAVALVRRGADAGALRRALVRELSASEPDIRARAVTELEGLDDPRAARALRRLARSTTLSWLAEDAGRVADHLAAEGP